MNRNFSLNKYMKNSRCLSKNQKDNIGKKSRGSSANSTGQNSCNSSLSFGANMLSKYMISKQIHKDKKNTHFPSNNYDYKISRVLENLKSNYSKKYINVGINRQNHSKAKNLDANVFKFFSKQNSIFYFLQNAVLKRSNSNKELTSQPKLLSARHQPNHNSMLKLSEPNIPHILGNSTKKTPKNAPNILILNSRNLKILEEEDSSQNYSNDSKEEQKGIESIKLIEDPNINSKRDFLFFSKDTAPTPSNGRKLFPDYRDTKASSFETEEYPIRMCNLNQISVTTSPPCYTTMSSLNKKYPIPKLAFSNYKITNYKSQGNNFEPSTDLLQFVKNKNSGILKSKRRSEMTKSSDLSAKNATIDSRAPSSNLKLKKENLHSPFPNPGDIFLI